MIVKSVGVVSVGRIYAAISAAVGLLIGLFFALAGVVGYGISGSDGPGFLAPLMGVGAVIILPLFYGAMGFIGGLIGALLYNVFAGMVGGVELRTE